MSQQRLFGQAALVVLAGLIWNGCASIANAQGGAYPHLFAALYEMKEAKAELKEERFKATREQAIRDLDAAIEETEKALRDAKVEYKYEGPKNPKEYYKDYKDFPHLRHAVIELREAKKEVKEEKKFNSERVLKTIDSAIDRIDAVLK
jgi:hypothetical protein